MFLVATFVAKPRRISGATKSFLRKTRFYFLYLLRTDYIEPNHAITGWNSGNLDALVASTEKAPRIMPQLRGGTVSQVKSSDRKKEDGVGYVLITR